jgi:hypothetical protein
MSGTTSGTTRGTARGRTGNTTRTSTGGERIGWQTPTFGMARIAACASALFLMAAAPAGCDSEGRGSGPDGGGTGAATGGGSGGVSGTGGRAAGTGGTAAGTGGTAAGTGGAAAGTGGTAAGTGGRAAGTGGGGAGTGGRAAGTGGTAAGTGGAAAGTGGAGGATLICRADEACTLGQDCQTACDTPAGQTMPSRSFCACVPEGGGRAVLACASVPCVADASTDMRPAVTVCPAGALNESDCVAGTDIVCATACTNQMQTRCVCAPRGGGGNPRWMCGGMVACQ